jgi:hypothetical protein
MDKYRSGSTENITDLGRIHQEGVNVQNLRRPLFKVTEIISMVTLFNQRAQVLNSLGIVEDVCIFITDYILLAVKGRASGPGVTTGIAMFLKVLFMHVTSLTGLGKGE